MRLSIIVVFLLLNLSASAQCWIEKPAFSVGEYQKYNAYYNWGFIWLNAGTALFQVNQTQYMGKDVYLLYGFGATHNVYDKFFRVREKYQSYIDKNTYQPVWYERDVIEDQYTAYEEYKFNHSTNLINTYVRTKGIPGRYEEFTMPNCLFDVMSAIYTFRSYDFSKYKPGDQIPLNIVLEREFYTLHLKYLGKETIETRNNSKFPCLKFAVELVEGSIFKAGEEALIYVSDDSKHIPVYVEAQIIIGKVKVILNEYGDDKGIIQANLN